MAALWLALQAEGGRLLQVFSNVTGKMGHRMGRMWDQQPFLHPATFDTLALDPALKQTVSQGCLTHVAGLLLILCSNSCLTSAARAGKS